jgi:multiple sugar transport system permease protein
VPAGRTTRSLPVAVYKVLMFEQTSPSPLAATVPYGRSLLLLQKAFMSGLTAGGVEGG